MQGIAKQYPDVKLGQFTRKLSSTEVELKRALLIKNVCISLVPLMISPSS